MIGTGHEPPRNGMGAMGAVPLWVQWMQLDALDTLGAAAGGADESHDAPWPFLLESRPYHPE